MINDVTLGGSVGGTLNSIKRASAQVEQTSMRLNTGKRVNSVLDQPQNFFSAFSLNNTATDYSQLIDGLNMGTRTIKEALTGLEAVEKVLRLAENKAIEAATELENTNSALPNAILADNPVGYYQLYDSNRTEAVNIGSLAGDPNGNGTYINGVSEGKEILFYGAGGLAAKFDGNQQYIGILPNDSINTAGPYNEKTIELTFNADSVAGRQVLFEEGGPVNNLNIYIDNGRVYVNGRTTFGGGWGPFNISTPIEAGVTYQVALVLDANNNRFSGVLNGEEFGSDFIPGPIGSHPNRNAIGAINQDIYFHDDGPGNAPTSRPDGSFAFRGEISDVAFYNDVISLEGLRERYEATSLPLAERFRTETIEFMEQISSIIEDSSFRGVNLLEKDELRIDLNQDRSNKLEVEGGNFSLASLGLDDISFQKPSQTEASIRKIREAIETIREYTSKLTSDVNIINMRETFTREKINTLKAGADDLTLADMNEEAANQLSAQTRLDLSVTALSLATASQQSILTLFSNGSGQVI